MKQLTLQSEAYRYAVAAFKEWLQTIGYNGPVAVETFSKALRELSPDEAAATARDAVARSLVSFAPSTI